MIATLLADDPARTSRLVVESGSWRADCSRLPVTSSRWHSWFEREALSDLIPAVARLFSGQIVNPSEQQPALHMALRALQPESYKLQPQQAQAIVSAREQVLDWSGQLFDGTMQPNGHTLKTLLHVGIGGSDLGPRLVSDALNQGQSAVQVEWLATLDGRRLGQLLARLDPATTGLVIASKSFTTVETRLQAQAIVEWLQAELGAKAASQCWAATANPGKAVEFGIPADQVIEFPHWVGGRFSLWSSVGMSTAAVVGPEQWRQLLHGAAEVDDLVRTDLAGAHALTLARCIDLLRREYGYPTLGVVSYEPALRLLAEYLQQLIMESLGKAVTGDGQPIEQPSAPLIFGGAGTDLQHSMFQALHQGTDRHPMLLLGAARPQHGRPAFHQEQLSHLLAQATALVEGVDSVDPQKQAQGNNPVMLMLTPEITARSLGQLLATFEHAVYLLGCLWNINPFDQWGVEDGKRRAGEFRKALADHSDAPEASMSETLDWILEQGSEK